MTILNHVLLFKRAHVILLNYKNNYVELVVNQNFLEHRSLFLRFQQNRFDNPTKLFSDLYPAKF